MTFLLLHCSNVHLVMKLIKVNNVSTYKIHLHSEYVSYVCKAAFTRATFLRAIF